MPRHRNTLPTPTQFHHSDQSPPDYSEPIPEQNTPLLDIFYDFSSKTPQDYLFHEQRLYQHINFHGKVRLGLGKAISVLQREIDQSHEYKPLIRPYQIDQPANTPMLSPLIPNTEAMLLANTFYALVVIIGPHRSLYLLITAKAHEIPGVLYVIERIAIPPRVSPIAASQSIIAAPQSMAQIGPFAPPRSDLDSTTINTDSTVYESPSTPSRVTHSSRPTMPIVEDHLSSEHLPTQLVIVRPHAPPSHPSQSLHNKQGTMPPVHDHPRPSQFNASTSNFGSVRSPRSIETNREYAAFLSQFQNMATSLIDHMNSTFRSLSIE